MVETFTYSLASRLRYIREDHGLTKSEMARSVGVTPPVWGAFENGTYYPSPEVFENLYSIYHVNDEWLEMYIGDIYRDGYKPGDPLGKPGDYKRKPDRTKEEEKAPEIDPTVVLLLRLLMKGRKENRMTKEELTQIRESLSLTKKEFAEKIGVKPMLLGRYESGGCKIPDAVAEAAKALVEPVEEDTSALIKQIRESLSLSKSALAKLVGVSPSAVGNYENGKSKPKDEILSKIKELVKEEAGPAAPVDEEQAAAAPIEEEKKPTSIVIESKMGGTITTEEILSRLPDGCDTVYVKPEENAAYWVKGAESGVINLW